MTFYKLTQVCKNVRNIFMLVEEVNAKLDHSVDFGSCYDAYIHEEIQRAI